MNVSTSASRLAVSRCPTLWRRVVAASRTSSGLAVIGERLYRRPLRSAPWIQPSDSPMSCSAPSRTSRSTRRASSSPRTRVPMSTSTCAAGSSMRSPRHSMPATPMRSRTRCSPNSVSPATRSTTATPNNSYLDAVLDRRLGIPITLSVLMIEVGRRLGVAVHGVGMPGHFLVGAGPSRVVRPLQRRHPPRRRGMRRTLLGDPDAAPRSIATILAPVGPLAILDRMLANLQHSLIERASGAGSVAHATSPPDPRYLPGAARRAGRVARKPRAVLRSRDRARHGRSGDARSGFGASCAGGCSIPSARQLMTVGR